MRDVCIHPLLSRLPLLAALAAATPALAADFNFIGTLNQREFRALLYSPDHRPNPVLVFAELGERAGAIGAALLPTSRHPIDRPWRH